MEELTLQENYQSRIERIINSNKEFLAIMIKYSSF